ncbi:uncharacterized protein LOC110038907 [Phalaenopsis equestris]|uniref:uncharacterized protein LOC110038907 n=1 Tax=Phalaenopsis equestris TaxID=78828 RepID=UPI0009E455A0|nr:uncharacterized protein LOC110038907 [Phalaenopsis equestris]XP_020599489.1 uncharacterized protein LOC110038907 [Phalaenopsis equestris]XP_020599490.1 uncharacterized protein LOC110038907 [Phalaenopsis equestris]
MGAICLNGKEPDPDIEEFEQETDRDVASSELEMEFEKMSKISPLTLDVICGKRTSRCWLKSCPCGNDSDPPNFACLLNSIVNLRQHSTYLDDYKGPFSLDMLNKTLSWFNSPLDPSFPEFIFEDLISQRKTSKFLSEKSVVESMGNVIPSHSEWWKLDAFEENSKAISLLKRSLFAHLSFLNGVINLHRSRSPSPMWRTLKWSKSPLFVNNTSSRSSKSESTRADEEASEVKFPMMKLISSSSSKSIFSWQSALSANLSIMKGQLQCFRKDGMPYFIFFLDDAPQVIYSACSTKIESSAEKASDTMYLFYCKGHNNGDSISRKHSMNSASLVAKMKVSSSILLSQNRTKIVETEFVLYGYQEEISNKLQKSSSLVSGSKVFPWKVAEIFKQCNMGKIQPKHKINDVGDINESNISNDASDVLLPNLELAAIVVKDSFEDTTNGLISGGWGLKFLEKVSKKNPFLETSLPSCRSKKDGSGRSLNVIIPADLHGGPVAPHGGPASIIDRWRSGGQCDCGGWDIGCPLTVLNQSTLCSSSSTKDAEKKTVDLYIQGKKKSGQPSLSMTKMTEGLYSICFQSSLSALQSFSIAVAGIHRNC